MRTFNTLIKAGWHSAQLQENATKTSALKMFHIGRIGKEQFHIALIGKEQVHGPWLYVKGEYRATQRVPYHPHWEGTSAIIHIGRIGKDVAQKA